MAREKIVGCVTAGIRSLSEVND